MFRVRGRTKGRILLYRGLETNATVDFGMTPVIFVKSDRTKLFHLVLSLKLGVLMMIVTIRSEADAEDQ